ncbi:hypothetical protein ACFOD4_14645 [Pseudoroseomonas globiformis]|uniref:Uncharacterized protein n=1 Tax=Teichococcus globiformis TaxID=2307229 RepID=A0ABV7G0V8_9PROT
MHLFARAALFSVALLMTACAAPVPPASVAEALPEPEDRPAALAAHLPDTIAGMVRRQLEQPLQLPDGLAVAYASPGRRLILILRQPEGEDLPEGIESLAVRQAAQIGALALSASIGAQSGAMLRRGPDFETSLNSGRNGSLLCADFLSQRPGTPLLRERSCATATAGLLVMMHFSQQAGSARDPRAVLGEFVDVAIPVMLAIRGAGEAAGMGFAPPLTTGPLLRL